MAELAGRGCGGWVPHTGAPEIVTHPPHPHPAAKSSVSALKFSPALSLATQLWASVKFLTTNTSVRSLGEGVVGG